MRNGWSCRLERRGKPNILQLGDIFFFLFLFYLPPRIPFFVQRLNLPSYRTMALELEFVSGPLFIPRLFLHIMISFSSNKSASAQSSRIILFLHSSEISKDL